MKILGIDPGLVRTGYGIIEKGKLKVHGFIKGNSSEKIEKRIKDITEKLAKIIRREKPQICAIESLFFRKVSARSIILSAQLRGAILYLLSKKNIEVKEYTPAKIKLAVTGNGRASKKQIRYMVKKLLKIENSKLHDDEADAIAAAYTAYKEL